VSPLNKKDHLTDGKIHLDCCIKQPHKINKTKFEMKKKRNGRPVLYGRAPQTKVTKIGWNAAGVIWLRFRSKFILEGARKDGRTPTEAIELETFPVPRSSFPSFGFADCQFLPLTRSRLEAQSHAGNIKNSANQIVLCAGQRKNANFLRSQSPF
jgi:hypothetical protein